MRSQYQGHPLPDKKDRGDIYPSIFLYGCGCWAAIVLAALAVWVAFGAHGW